MKLIVTLFSISVLFSTHSFADSSPFSLKDIWNITCYDSQNPDSSQRSVLRIYRTGDTSFSGTYFFTFSVPVKENNIGETDTRIIPPSISVKNDLGQNEEIYTVINKTGDSVEGVGTKHLKNVPGTLFIAGAVEKDIFCQINLR